MILTGRSPRGMIDIGELDSILGFKWVPSYKNIAGSESSRMMLATSLLLLLPWLSTQTAQVSWGKPLRILAGIATAFGLVLILHPVLLLIGVTGIVLATGLAWRRQLAAVIAASACLLTIACATLQPHYGKIMLDAAAIQKTGDPYGTLPMPMQGESMGNTRVWMLTQQKYLEWQAVGNALYKVPWFGHGLGNYQSVINRFYSEAPMLSLSVQKEPANFMERDAHGWLQVILVECGLLGLASLLMMLGMLAQLAFRTWSQTIRSTDSAAAIAVFVVTMLASPFANVMVSGLNLLFIAIVAAGMPPIQLTHATGEETV